MRTWMNYMMLSCKRATELIEKRQVSQLKTTERLQLKLHLSLCDACHAYEHQSQVIDRALSQWFNQNQAKDAKQLSPTVKGEIKKKLEE